MADDSYQFDDDKLELSAGSDLGGAGEFDDLEADSDRFEKPRRSKRPLVLALLLLVIVGGAGAFFAYQMFSAAPDMPIETARPIDLAASGLPPQVTPGETPADSAAPVVNAGEVAPVVPGEAAAAATDPNAVTATALPAPPVLPGTEAAPAAPAVVDAAAVTPSAAVISAATPADVTASVTPVIPGAAVADPVPAAADNAIAADVNAAAAAAVPGAAPAIANAVAIAATQDANKKMISPEAALNKGADLAKPVMPAPPEQQLKPIDPKEITAGASVESATQKVQNNVEKKTADTIAAVNDILGSELPNSGNKTIDSTIAKAMGKKPEKAANAPPPPPTEVTSRAHQVIQVKRSYSAQSSQAINAAGDRVLQANQYDSAIDIYNKQLQNNPSDPNALSGKALALQKANRDTEAMDAYQRVAELNPRDIEALTNYLGLLQKQKPEEAMGRLNALADKYPDNAAVAGQIGAVFAGQMDTPNALRYFMKAKSLDATNPTYPFNIAVLYDRMNNQDKAADYYRLALTTIASYPESAEDVPVQAIRNRIRQMNN